MGGAVITQKMRDYLTAIDASPLRTLCVTARRGNIPFKAAPFVSHISSPTPGNKSVRLALQQSPSHLNRPYNTGILKD